MDLLELHDSAVSIVTGYGLGGRCSVHGWGKRIFSTPQRSKTGSGAYPASYPMRTGGYFPRG
jgi:hypothetical protein